MIRAPQFVTNALLHQHRTTLPFRAPGPILAQRSALLIAHPGHELRLHGWLERARPLTFALTDGSGMDGRPRLDSTTAVLSRVGARPAGIYGRFPGAAFYQALVERRFGLFDRLADELCEELATQEIQVIVSDAAEGHHPASDVCHLLADTAVERLRRRGIWIASYDFPLAQRPDACPAELRGSAVWMQLGPNNVGRKLAAARGYAELGSAVEAAVRHYGLAAFAVECLRPAVCGAIPGLLDRAVMPFYELDGQRRLRAGHCRQVIRCQEHIAPLARHLFHQFAEAAA